MLALSVIGCLLAAVLIMLLIPVRIRFEYKGNVLKADIRYLFLRYDFFPKEDTKDAVKKEFKKQKKEENKKPKKPRAAMDTVKTIMTILKSSEWGLKCIFRHIVFYSVKIYISVSEPDASQTAQSYGKLCAIIYPGIQLFKEIFILKEPDVIIAPDFLSEKSRYEIVFKARLMPIIVIIALTDALIKYIHASMQNKEERRKKKDKIKDGRKDYEPAASNK